MARKKWDPSPTPAEQARAKVALRELTDWAALTDAWDTADYNDIEWLRDALSAAMTRNAELKADMSSLVSMTVTLTRRVAELTRECRCQRIELKAKARRAPRKFSLDEDV